MDSNLPNQQEFKDVSSGITINSSPKLTISAILHLAADLQRIAGRVVAANYWILGHFWRVLELGRFLAFDVHLVAWQFGFPSN